MMVIDHDVVEVRDHEVGVVHVDVDAHRRQEEAREAANREEADEPERESIGDSSDTEPL